MLRRVVKNYWVADETNIFRNYRDALAGFIVLVVLPALSIFFAIYASKYTFWNYAFPIISVSLAGAYDAYGRYDGESPKNVKLAARVIIDFIAIFFVALSIGNDSIVLTFAAPVLLSIC